MSPYIKSNDGRRDKLVLGAIPKNAGELNFTIFHFFKYNVKNLGVDYSHAKTYVYYFVEKYLGKERNYQKYNDITGVLIRCAREIERRLNLNVAELFMDILNSYDEEINDYENLKIKSNGDV